MKLPFAHSLIQLALGLAFLKMGVAEEAETILDIEDVLNKSVDDVEDAPEFVTPPAGKYKLDIINAKIEKYDSKDRDENGTLTGETVKKTRLKIFYAVKETVELADESEQPVAPGSMFNETFQANKVGLSFFKRQAKKILGEENIKGCTIGQIVEVLAAGEQTCEATVGTKTTKAKHADAQGKKRDFTNTQVKITKGTQGVELPEDEK